MFKQLKEKSQKKEAMLSCFFKFSNSVSPMGFGIKLITKG
jgi:hypothetical protein